jgi:glycosyltransferase involved in cell wall biosynthesis
MNVGYVVTDLSLSGTPAFVEFAGLGLLRRGHSITIVAEKEPHDRDQRLREAGATVHSFGSPAPISVYAGCFKENNVALVHLNVWERARSLLALKHELGVPVVQHYHHVPRITRKVRIRQLVSLARSRKGLYDAYRSWKECDGYICCCATSARATKIEFWPFGWRKIFSLPNAIYFSGKMVAKEVLCGPPKFIQVGSLTERKDPIATLSAFAIVKQRFPLAELNYVGDGPLWQRLHEMTDAQQIGNVHFLGDLKDVSGVLLTSNIAVLPSWMEGLPYTLIEAAAVGLPLVASRADGIPEIVMDGVNGILFDPGDIPALSAAMMRLAASADLREGFGAAGYEHFKQNFQIEKHLDKLESIYRLICRRSGRHWL